MGRRNVLITLDGSELSTRILAVVRGLFPPDQAELTFLRIAQPLIEPPVAAYVHAQQTLPDIQLAHWDRQLAEQEWTAYLQAIREELNNEAVALRNDGYTVHTVVETGVPVDAIADYITKHPIDLLAMATHGRRGLSKMMLGSVAEQLLRQLPIPILLIRPGGDGG
ncbi:MAG: universal stress protein [Caldilineaceae bacterium]|nr:universal stress protein [Caldilineaceae bacterium]